MSVPAVVRVTAFCCGLLSVHALANPIPLSNSLVQTETIYQQEAHTRMVTFMVQVDAGGESREGQLMLQQETFMNGSVVDFTSEFDGSLPEGVKLPAQERIVEENGTITTNTLYGNDSVGEVRMHMYGTFADLERLVTTIALRHHYGYVSGSDKEYQSQYLLMAQPASIISLEIDANSIGQRVELMMSNDSTITYQWNSDGQLFSVAVDDGEAKITYTVTSFEEG